MKKAPTIKNAPGTAAARANGELLREVWAPGMRAGFLLTVREVPQGGVLAGTRLVVEVHGADPGVFVRINGRDFKAPK